MFRYLIVFLIVIILSGVSANLYKKSKFASYLLSFICILIISLFAGLRGYTVGTDIHVYGWEYFYDSSKYKTLIEYLASSNFAEPLYYALNYILFRVFGDIHYWFFIMQFIISSLIYSIAYKELENKNGCFVFYIMCYLFIWFNSSLNIMRQSLALIFVLYGFRYIENGNIKKYFLFNLIAFLFHSSSIICVIFPFLYRLSCGKNSIKKLVIISFCLLLFFSILKYLFGFLIAYFPFFSKYFNYMLYSEGNMITNYAVYKFIFLIIVLLFCKPLLKNNNKNNILIYFIVFDFIFYVFSYFVKFGYRISYFFLPFYIYLLPRIDSSLKNHEGRDFYRIVLVILLLSYWLYRFVKVGYDGTIPYLFWWE